MFFFVSVQWTTAKMPLARTFSSSQQQFSWVGRWRTSYEIIHVDSCSSKIYNFSVRNNIQSFWFGEHKSKSMCHFDLIFRQLYSEFIKQLYSEFNKQLYSEFTKQLYSEFTKFFNSLFWQWPSLSICRTTLAVWPWRLWEASKFI